MIRLTLASQALLVLRHWHFLAPRRMERAGKSHQRGGFLEEVGAGSTSVVFAS